MFFSQLIRPPMYWFSICTCELLTMSHRRCPKSNDACLNCDNLEYSIIVCQKQHSIASWFSLSGWLPCTITTMKKYALLSSSLDTKTSLTFPCSVHHDIIIPPNRISRAWECCSIRWHTRRNPTFALSMHPSFPSRRIIII